MRNTESFRESLRMLRKTGTAHATGDGLRAMYAQLICNIHGGDLKTIARFYFPHLQKRTTDEAVTNESRELLRDRAAAWDVIMGLRD